jgi:hypothetical protein
MAEQCAACGRSDLLQPDVANYQCLACGALTSMATGQVVPVGVKGPNLSNAGLPVVELSNGVVEQEANDFDRREREIGEPVEETTINEVTPEPEPRPARVDESYVPAAPEVTTVPEAPVEPPSVMGTSDISGAPSDIDFSALTPDQVAEIEKIAHPEV